MAVVFLYQHITEMFITYYFGSSITQKFVFKISMARKTLDHEHKIHYYSSIHNRENMQITNMSINTTFQMDK